MGKTKDLEPLQKKHLPKALSELLLKEQELARAQIEQINAGFQKTATLLFQGYVTSLDPQKTYTLSSDLKTFIEK